MQKEGKSEQKGKKRGRIRKGKGNQG